MSRCIVFVITILNFTTNVKASAGDRTQYYISCTNKCVDENCENVINFKENPTLDLRLLFWTCKEDCRYFCMMKTVDRLIELNLPVPQFHGKWPFVRFFGLQEPASVLFSILNLYAHVTCYLKLKKELTLTKDVINYNRIKSYPMFYVWTWFTVVCLNGWCWSTIFHARDKNFTEVMDYSCGFAIVLTLLYCVLLRLTYKYKTASKMFVVISCVYLATFYTHLTHIWSGSINYSYNMTFNIVIGFLTFFIAMIWWYKSYNSLPHVHLFGWFTVLTVLVTLLEISDFPPILWILDAHSLWHASTVPLVPILYRFITLDCLYLKRQYSKLKTDRL